jgi:hypothetical protein
LADLYPSWKAEASRFGGRAPFEAAMAGLLREEESAFREQSGSKEPKHFVWEASKGGTPKSTDLQWDLAAFFFGFDHRPDSLYERFCGRAAGAIRSGAVRLASLNYDVLLPRALERAGVPFDVGQIGAEAGAPWVCLPHGSSMFDCQAGVGRDGALSTGGKGLAMEITPGLLGLESSGALRLFSGADQLRGKRARQQGPPTLCFIEPGKAVTSCVNVIQTHQARWREWVAGASRLAVIGAKVAEADTHIWGPAGSAVRRGIDCFYASGSAAKQFGEWCARNGRPPTGQLPEWYWDKAFAESCTFLGV